MVPTGNRSSFVVTFLLHVYIQIWIASFLPVLTQNLCDLHVPQKIYTLKTDADCNSVKPCISAKMNRTVDHKILETELN